MDAPLLRDFLDDGVCANRSREHFQIADQRVCIRYAGHFTRSRPENVLAALK
jgi:hypothetical protein